MKPYNVGTATGIILLAFMAVRATTAAMLPSQLFSRDVACCKNGSNGPSKTWDTYAKCEPNCYCQEDPNDSAQGAICKGTCLDFGHPAAIWECKCNDSLCSSSKKRDAMNEMEEVFRRSPKDCVDGQDVNLNEYYDSEEDCEPNCYLLESPNDSAQGAICKGYCDAAVIAAGRNPEIKFVCRGKA